MADSTPMVTFHQRFEAILTSHGVPPDARPAIAADIMLAIPSRLCGHCLKAGVAKWEKAEGAVLLSRRR